MSIENNLQYDVDLSQMSTIGVGGIASSFILVSTKDELEEIIAYCDEGSHDFKVIGQGSNILFSEGTYSGVVIKLVNDAIDFKNLSDTVTEVNVESGRVWDEFVWECATKGLSGLETLAGIPGLVGASPIQNIGAYGREVSEFIIKVEVFDVRSKKFRWLLQSECNFSYRDSIFKSGNRSQYIIWSVCFQLNSKVVNAIKYEELQKRLDGKLSESASQADKLKVVYKTVKDIRQSKSMVFLPEDKNSHSLGSFFKNPIVSKSIHERFLAGLQGKFERVPTFAVEGEQFKVSAAWLIENAGFKKGYTYKNVGLSNNHCLAIISHGGGFKEILELKEMIAHKVEDRFGIRLEMEPEIFMLS